MGDSEDGVGHRCTACGLQLASRNALFKHIRLSHESKTRPARRSEALLLMYDRDGSAAEASVAAALTAEYSNPPESISRASSAMARGSVALAQEAGLGACADVLVVNFCGDAGADDLAARLNSHLDRETRTRVLRSVPLVGHTRPLHAERSCTKRVYRYLLPVRWLGAAVEPDLASIEAGCVPESAREVFRGFKAALMSVTAVDASSLTSVNSHRKARRGWHNFAAPDLRGAASPTVATVWRVLDNVRMAGTLALQGEAHIIIELRADGFLCEQARRIVGSALAVARGWLPDDFFSKATRSDAIVDTPLAPPGRAYLSAVSYDLFTQTNGGEPLFDLRTGRKRQGGLKGGRRNRENLCEAEKGLIDRLVAATSAQDEQDWLRDLETITAPRIQMQLAELALNDLGRSNNVTGAELPIGLAVPTEFEQILSLLRAAVASGQWPETSESRASLHSGASGGSFTVASPAFLAADTSVREPLKNKIFPELPSAVFTLEQAIAPSRPPSTRCAVNWNARFKPYSPL